MRIRCRQFLVYLLVICVVGSQPKYYGQDEPPEQKETAGKSIEHAREQYEIQKYNHVLTPQERQNAEDKEREERWKWGLNPPPAKRTPATYGANEQKVPREIQAQEARIRAEELKEQFRTEIQPLKPSIHTFLIAPINSEEYLRIFGTKEAGPQDTTMAQNREISRIRQQMQADFGYSVGSRNLSSKNVWTAIANSQSSFILIVGHNDRGSFRFLDGSSVQLNDLVTATRPDQRMIIVSCNAETMLSNQAAPKAAATQNDLTYPQAFEIAKTIQKYLASANTQVSLEMVKQVLQSAESQSALRCNTRFLVTRVVLAAGVATVIGLVVSGGVSCLLEDECR